MRVKPLAELKLVTIERFHSWCFVQRQEDFAQQSSRKPSQFSVKQRSKLVHLIVQLVSESEEHKSLQPIFSQFQVKPF